MSVYTTVSALQMDAFFSYYHLGKVLSFTGIKDGMVNTNYFVTTTHGDFVLTLFENMTTEEVEGVVKLLTHLADHKLFIPHPQYDQNNQALRQLNRKTALICQRLAGAAIITPTIEHCVQIGLQLATLHNCTQNYNFPIKNPYDLNGLTRLFHRLSTQLSQEDKNLINDELLFQAQYSTDSLPTGLIHADLFRDNVLFVGDKLSGMLDFYSACHGTLLFDVAVTANDWCCDDGQINATKMTAVLSSYQSIRPLYDSEKQCWPVMLRRAALRFWLARLEYQSRARTGELIQQKDPLVFRRILLQHQQQS